MNDHTAAMNLEEGRGFLESPHPLMHCQPLRESSPWSLFPQVFLWQANHHQVHKVVVSCHFVEEVGIVGGWSANKSTYKSEKVGHSEITF